MRDSPRVSTVFTRPFRVASSPYSARKIETLVLWEAVIIGKLTTLMTGFLAAGMIAGIFVRPLLVPWALASVLFLVNYAVSLIFLKAIARLSTAAAAGLALFSFFLRFGLLGLSLVAVALALPQYLLATAICFLLVYTLFMALEIAVGIKGRSVQGPPAAGGEA